MIHHHLETSPLEPAAPHGREGSRCSDDLLMFYYKYAGVGGAALSRAPDPNLEIKRGSEAEGGGGGILHAYNGHNKAYMMCNWPARLCGGQRAHNMT